MKPVAQGLMRSLAVVALCAAPGSSTSAQQRPPSSVAQAPALNDMTRQATLLTVDAIEAGPLDGGGSTVLRDKDGRTLPLAQPIPAQAFRNVPVRQLLESLAQQSGIGVRFGADVATTTTVTLTITRPTPAAEVLTVVLSAAQLQAAIMGTKVLVVTER